MLQALRFPPFAKKSCPTWMYDRNDHWRKGPLYDGRASKMHELLEGERDLSCCCCCCCCSRYRALSAACKEKIISTSTKDKKNTEKKQRQQQYYNINKINTSRICAKEPTNTYYNFEENNVYNKFY